MVIVDPGIRGSGVAVFEHDTLSLASYVFNSERKGNGPAECVAMAFAIVQWFQSHYYRIADVNALICEWPRIHTASKQRKGDGWADPNDLLPLVGVNCAASVFFCARATRYYPDEWKGQVEKHAMNERVLERLSPEERKVIVHVGALDHNTLDAIGIGLHHVGRLERKRVIAR